MIHHGRVGERRVLGKPILPRQKILIAHAERAGGQRADIDPGAGTKQNAAGINQNDLPIGGERPEDRTGLRPENTVERD